MKMLLTALALGSLLATASSVDVSAIGSWNEVIDASDLSAGAGNDLISQLTGVAGATTLDISNTTGGAWRVYARRADNTWNPKLTLSIRRSSTGSGAGSISGGESFVELTNTDTEIFVGSGDRSAVAIQTQLNGVSVSIRPDVFSTGIIFTVVP